MPGQALADQAGYSGLFVHWLPVTAELPGAVGDRGYLRMAGPGCHRLHSVLHGGWRALYLGSLAPGLVSRRHMFW